MEMSCSCFFHQRLGIFTENKDPGIGPDMHQHTGPLIAAQTLVEKTGAGSLLMIYGIFAAVMIGGYQYFVRRGEKRGYRAV